MARRTRRRCRWGKAGFPPSLQGREHSFPQRGKPALSGVEGVGTGGNIALIAADELESLVESAHVLRYPKNAERLLAALDRALKSESKPCSIDSLRKEVGLEKQA